MTAHTTNIVAQGWQGKDSMREIFCAVPPLLPPKILVTGGWHCLSERLVGSLDWSVQPAYRDKCRQTFTYRSAPWFGSQRLCSLPQHHRRLRPISDIHITLIDAPHIHKQLHTNPDKLWSSLKSRRLSYLFVILQIWIFLYVCVLVITLPSPLMVEQTLRAFIDILLGQGLRNAQWDYNS